MSHIGQTIHAILSPVLDLIYPPVCLICEQEDASSPEHVCEKCWGKLIALLNAHTPASAYKKRTSAGRRVVSLGAYDPPLEGMIKQFKYHGFTRLGERLAGQLITSRKAAMESLIAGKA
ncbi:hypothetical protein JYT16_02425, partial [Gemmatimonas aurantiaca]|nr:hypothetical protein [Gemmatimonas aurantiaca]